MLEVGVCFPLAMPLGVCFEARIDVGVCLHLFLFAEVKFLCSRVENHRELGKVRSQKGRRQTLDIAAYRLCKADSEAKAAHHQVYTSLYRHFPLTPRHISFISRTFHTY